MLRDDGVMDESNRTKRSVRLQLTHPMNKEENDAIGETWKHVPMNSLRRAYTLSQKYTRKRASHNSNEANAMTTRAATFSAKIRNLTDHYQRVLHQNQPPSGLEIVNTLRYFQQTLLSFLKDVQSVSADFFKSESSDSSRQTLFPNLNYTGLYHAICSLIEVHQDVPSGQIAMAQALLATLKCVYIFVDKETLEMMPLSLATYMPLFSPSLFPDILHLICDVLLPFTLARQDVDTYATSSIAGIMMMVFGTSKEASHHTWLMETLMALRAPMHQDVTYVIACGTSEARVVAANLLLHYWPLMNPQVIDRKPVQYKPLVWTPVRCDRKDCIHSNVTVTKASGSISALQAVASGSTASNALELVAGLGGMDKVRGPGISVMKCYDATLCAEIGDTAPPMLLCKTCSEKTLEEHKTSLFHICQAMPSVTVNVCQNRGCQSSSRMTICTCFSDDCIRAHQHVPIRLCSDCHEHFHAQNTDGANHIYHTSLPCPWEGPYDVHRNTVVAIVQLLKETTSILEGQEKIKRPKWLQQLEGREPNMEMAEERKMLSRYAVWLLAALCYPKQGIPAEAVGHLFAMLTHWFATTALLPNDSTGLALEQLKTDFVVDWLNAVLESHYDVFVESLKPNPPEFAKVGGLWEKLARRTDQIREGLCKILALIPYDVISFDTWNRIMPEWLEAICTEVAENELGELKVMLGKIFEVDLCSLPFPPEEIYKFIALRMEKGEWFELKQAMDWLQILTESEITIPFNILLPIIISSCRHLAELHKETSLLDSSTKSPSTPLKPHPRVVVREDSIGAAVETDLMEEDRPCSPFTPEGSPIRKTPAAQLDSEEEGEESNVDYFVAIIFVLSRQMELNENEIQLHAGTGYANIQSLLKVVVHVLKTTWTGIHSCSNPENDEFVDCVVCQETSFFFELLMQLIERICPVNQVRIEMPPEEEYDWEEPEPIIAGHDISPAQSKHDAVPVSTVGAQPGAVSGTGGPVKYGLVSGEPCLATATQQEESEEVEFVSFLATEEIETAMAQAVTLTETDVGLATCKVMTATLVDEHGNGGVPTSPDEVTFWHTSLGKFRFTLEELPAQLQLMYFMMIKVEEQPNPDAIYFLLHSMKYLCLHAEALNNAHRENRGFLIWAQENILISKMWHILKAEYSQTAEMCVPLMLHCLTLPSGADAFWLVVNDNFTSSDWKHRFSAVEKVTLISQFLDPNVIRGNIVLQAALANAFCFLIASSQDPNSAIAQRAILSIGTIQSPSLKCLCHCLEAQFDAAIVDRSLIIHRLHLLTCLLPDQPILSWDFFLQRFDALTLEAQLFLERTGDIAMATDLMRSDPTSDLYQRKVNRARKALENSDTIRSIVRSMDKALPYQKALAMHVQSKIAKETPVERMIRLRREMIAKRRESQLSVAGQHLQKGFKKVFMMVKVVNAWRGFRTKFNSSWTSLASLISGQSSLTHDEDEEIFQEQSASREDSTSQKAFKDSPESSAGYVISRMKEFTDEESNFCLVLNKAMDLESTERHTMFLIIVLFMKFLSAKNTSLVSPDEKAAAKKQSIVLRHLNVLLGYSNSEKCFTIPPDKLRASAICNAFLSNAPLVLDNNLLLGKQILPLMTMLLQYLPSPQKFASDTQTPDYSLWLLESHSRHHWFWVVLLILYKYRFDQPPINERILILIRLLINTLDAQVHECDHIDGIYSGAIFESKDSLSDSELEVSETSKRRSAVLGGDRHEHRKKAMAIRQKKKPTFDEREEAILEEEHSSPSYYEMTPASPQWASAGVTMQMERVYMNPSIEEQHFQPPAKVETRIEEQIAAFDRSFEKEGSKELSELGMATTQEMARPELLQDKPRFEVGEPSSVIELGQQMKSDRILSAQGPIEMKPMEEFETIEEETEWGSVCVQEPVKLMSLASPIECETIEPSVNIAFDAHVVNTPTTTKDSLRAEPSYKLAPCKSLPPKLHLQSPPKTRRSPYTSPSKTRDRKTGAKTLGPKSPKEKSYLTSSRDTKTVRYNQNALRSENSVLLRCMQCNQPIQCYDEDTLTLATVCLSTFVHREPSMAAPYLHKILMTVAKVAHNVEHPWQAESNVFVPGNSRSVSRQCLRVILHQLATNGIFYQLFQSQILDKHFFKTVSVALNEFPELNPVSVVQHLMEDLIENWLPHPSMVLYNLASYIQHVPVDTNLQTWLIVINSMDVFFRRYQLESAVSCLGQDFKCILMIMVHVMKVQNLSAMKGSTSLLDGWGKLLTQALALTSVELSDILLLCTACNRAFLKDRERQGFSKTCVVELVHAIKFKVQMPEDNYLTLLYLILQDAGEPVPRIEPDVCHTYNTGAAECARAHMQDFVDFIGDLHVLNKVKNMARGMGFREDTLGGELKAGLSQYIAVEIAKISVRDPRTVIRYLPWLLTSPSMTQTSPTEFVDCVARVRMLSWVLLGALKSTALGDNSADGQCSCCLPIPIDTSQHIADQIQFVLAGFAERSKESVVHMSSLFHAFHLCQLWTVYCERASISTLPHAAAVIIDFWPRITPAVLQLLAHSKVLADMVNLHFLSTIEALHECQSSVLCRLYPMWEPILSAYHTHVPGHLRVRMEAFENRPPHYALLDEESSLHTWLKRVHFKIGQIELQSSAATEIYTTL